MAWTLHMAGPAATSTTDFERRTSLEPIPIEKPRRDPRVCGNCLEMIWLALDTLAGNNRDDD